MKVQRFLLPLLLAAVCGAAQAVPIVTVDADPTLAGIQSTRTVTLGDTFDVLVTIDNAGTPFDEGAFDLLVLDLFQDPAFVAAVTTPVGPAIAGDLVATAPLFALDLFGVDLPIVGSPLAFGGTSGQAIGLLSLGLPFGVPDAGAIGVALFRFAAGALGSSVLAPGADAINDGFVLSNSFALGSSQFVASLGIAATIHVVAPAQVPEPAVWALLALGVLLLAARRQRSCN